MEGEQAMKRTRIVIMGAAGRDFHNFNMVFRNDPACRVVAFTAAQIPGIGGRRYPPELAGKLYPRGIPVYPEEMLAELIASKRIEQVVFAYSDISHEQLMHTASRVLAAGADFRLIGPDATMLASSRPVVSVCAVRTGCGKSQVVRLFCDTLVSAGITPVVVRHPMPYGDLRQQAEERFACRQDLQHYRCTVEEREEYEHLLEHGAVVYAGVDYRRILRRAEQEARLIIWDGGNNDLPFFRPDLEIVVADPLRPGHETSWYPGEVNLRRAGMVIINKVNAAETADIEQVVRAVAACNPAATVIRTNSVVSVAAGESLHGKRVLVVEDGPTVTHGTMPSGAGLAAAREQGARVVDPRPYAVGSLRDVFAAWPHIGPVLPAVGYWPEQLRDLEATVARVPCDLILSATPVDLAALIGSPRPVRRVTYAIEEPGGDLLRETILRMAHAGKMECGNG
jgi:predicted GTPase